MKNAGCLGKGLLLVLGWLSLHAPAGASFDLERTGARSLGLAGAFCGLADDADALFYNPAGLAQNQAVLIALGYGKLLGGLEDGLLAENRLAYVQPLRSLGSAGFAWHQVGLSGVYQENVFSLDYAAALEPSRRSFLGGGLRILNVSYDQEVTGNNDYFAGTVSRTGVSLDVGGLMYLSEAFSFGAAMFNVLPARVALQADADPLPLQVRAGIGYHGPSQAAAVDVLAYSGRYRIAGGGEWWWFQRTLAARLGVACGDSGLLETGAGLSLNLDFGNWGGQLDYAYQLPWGEASGLGSSHHLNLTFKLQTESPETIAGREFLQAGHLAYSRGKYGEALKAWEEAARLLPSDPVPTGLIKTVKMEINRLQLTETEAREKERTSQRAATPKWQRPEIEHLPAMAVETTALDQPAAEKAGKSMRYGQEKQGKPEIAEAFTAEKKRAAPIAAAARPANIQTGAPAAEQQAAKPAAGTPAAAPAPGPAQLRRRARGAYGRAVKLMLEIDKASGRAYFPQAYEALQSEMQALKLLLKSEDYQKIIENAEKLFPELEKLKRQSAKKKTNSEIMPTHW